MVFVSQFVAVKHTWK